MTHVTCPSCGKPVASDLWEFEEGDHEIECGWCEYPVVLKVVVSVDYDVVERVKVARQEKEES